MSSPSRHVRQNGPRPRNIVQALTGLEFDTDVATESLRYDIDSRTNGKLQSNRENWTMRNMNYKQKQLNSQIEFLATSDTFDDVARGGGGSFRGRAYDFVLSEEYEAENLFPAIRESVRDYFERHNIVWHKANAHLLSSQVCCVNFFEPFSRSPDSLKSVLTKVVGPIAEMLQIEPESDPGRYIAFEFIGAEDYLNEGRAGRRTRGANCTSVDAAVRYRTPAGSVEIALIEWKYTEAYGAPLRMDPRKEERLRRYKDIAFYPNGPLRPDCGVDLATLFTEPFYQLLRQQMLAFQIAKKRELQAQQARTVYISPRGNIALKQIRIDTLKRFGLDVSAAWSTLLQSPDHFIPYATEQLFANSLELGSEFGAWQNYMARRYCFG
jgi:hypothetical protein